MSKRQDDLLKRIRSAACWSPMLRSRRRYAPKLPTLARFIRETWPQLIVTCERWTTSTDSAIAGTRLRREGRGRVGYRLRVREPGGGNILDHESSDPDRHNGEVCQWIVRRIQAQDLQRLGRGGESHEQADHS